MAENKYKEAFKKIAGILGAQFEGEIPAPPIVAPVVEPIIVQLQDVTLKDGSILSVDKLEVGGIATTAGVSAAIGDYEVSDGSIIKVGEGGKITEIVPIPVIPPAEVPPAQMQQPVIPNPVAQPVIPSPQFEEMQESFNQSFAAQKESFEKQVNELKSDFTNAQGLIEKQGQAIEQMFALMREFANVPAADPIEPPKLSFAQEQVEGRKEQMQRLADTTRKFQEQHNK